MHPMLPHARLLPGHGQAVAVVDPMNPRSLYLQVADAVQEDIRAGRLRAGAMLPGELRLAQEYGVARGTARAAVAELRRRGLVVTMPQRGTYVVETPNAPPQESQGGA